MNMVNRKQVLQLLAGLPFVGSLATHAAREGRTTSRVNIPRRDYFTELGVRKVINARGVVTTLTGSLMHPEVVEAI
ncbi:MAG: selenocysteine synthase, partial [Bacteroidota bacterium]